MKIPIRPRPLPISPGSGLFVSKPFYYDDDTIKVGADTSDLEAALNRAAAALDRHNQRVKSFGINYIQTFQTIENGVNRHVVEIEKRLGGNKIAKFKLTLEPDERGNLAINNLETKISKFKDKLAEASDQAKELGANLAKLASGATYQEGQLKGGTFNPLKNDPTNIIRGLTKNQGVRGADPSAYSKVQLLEQRFQQEIDKVLQSSDRGAAQLEKGFAALATGKLEKIPSIAARAVIAYQRLKKAVEELNTVEQTSIADQRRVELGVKSQNIIREHFRPQLNQQFERVDQVKSRLNNAFDISGLAVSTDKEFNKYNNAILRATEEIKKLKDIKPEDFDKVFDFVDSGAVNKFTGDQAKLFNILLRVRDALDGVGVSAQKMGASLNSSLSNTTRAQDLSNQFRNLLGPIPTNIAPSIEKQLNRAITAVGEKASTNEFKTEFIDIERISNDVARGVVTDWTQVGAEFKTVAQAIINAHEQLQRLTATSNRVQAIPLARKELLSSFTPSPERFAEATDAEKIRFTKTVETAVSSFGKLKDSEATIEEWRKVVGAVLAGSENDFHGWKASVFRDIEAVSNASKGVGGAVQAKKDLSASLGVKERSIVEAMQQRLGPLYIAPEVDQAKARGFITAWKNIYRQLAKESVNINEGDFESLLTAAENALKTHGQSLIDVKLFDQQGATVRLNNLITLLKRVEAANEKAIQTANKQVEKGAKTEQSALVGTRPEERTRAERVHNLITRGGLGRAPLLDQLRPGSLGELPSGVTRGEANRVQNYINTINQLLASGKQALSDYDRAIENVINKKIVPPNASGDFRSLQNAIAGVGNVQDTVANRQERLNGTLVSFKNVLRLGIVSEIYNIYSQLRAIAEQSIDSFNKLTVQIAQIQAITQDVNATTSQWADTLRRVSDISGKDLTEVSVAAYDALSNQITRTREDTEAFLNTALQFGKTVGATPTEAVNLLSSSINAYGKSAADAEQLSAEFFAVIDIGRVKAADLQNILGRVGITAATLGVKTHELGAALAVLTQNGLTTEDAITRLNNLLVKLFNPTKEMQKLFSQFGVTSAQQFIAVNNGLGGTVEAIENAVKRGDAAVSELFPEIRTLAGYFGLSGQNAAKFADAIKKVEDSLPGYKRAIQLTDQAPIGQRFATEINKIKNVFTVDFAEGFSRAFVTLSDSVGGLADRIRELLYVGSKIITIVGPILTVSIAIKNLTRLTTLLSGAWALFTVGFKASPIGRVLTIATAAFFGLKVVIDTVSEAVDNYNKRLSEGRAAQIKTSPYTQEIDRMGKAVQRHAEIVNSLITKAWSQAAANINLTYDKVINAQRIKIEGLVNRTKSSFSDVSNLISKTISALENYEPEASKIQRKLPLERSQYATETQVDYLHQLLSAQKEFESQAGFKGVSNTQVAIYDQIVAQINQGTEQLRQEANKIFDETLDPSEQKAAVDAYVEGAKKAITEYNKLRDEIISAGVAAGKSGYQIQAMLDAIIKPRVEPIQNVLNLNLDAFSKKLESTKQGLEGKLTPLYELEAEIKALNSRITDLDIEKTVADTEPIYEGGKIKKSRQQVFNERYVQPAEEQRASIAKRFEDINKQNIPGARGITEALSAALKKMDRDIENLKQGRAGFIKDIISKKDIETATANLDTFQKSHALHIKNLIADLSKYKEARIKLFDEILTQADKLNSNSRPSKDIQAFGEANVDKARNAIGFLKEQSNVGRTPEEKINNVRNAAKAAREAFDTLKNINSEAFNVSGFKQQEEALTAIEEALGRTDVFKSKEKQTIEDIEELQATLANLKLTIGDTPEVLRKNADAFKALLDSLPPDKIQELTDKILGYAAAVREASSVGIPPGITARGPVPDINTPSMNRAQEEVFNKGPIDRATIREFIKDYADTPNQSDIYTGTHSYLINKFIPTTPTPGATESNKAVPTLPLDNKVIADKLDRLIQLGEAQAKSGPQNVQIPQAESHGGVMSSYYARGGWAWMEPKGTDTIPAMLTPGEYVMPAKQTQKYRHILERMRAGTYYQEGGITSNRNLVSNVCTTNDRRINNYYQSGGDIGTKDKDKDIVTFMAAGGLLLTKGTYYPEEEKSGDICTTKEKIERYYQEGGTVDTANIQSLISTWNSQSERSSLNTVSQPLHSITKLLVNQPESAYRISEHIYEKSIPRRDVVERSRLLLGGRDTSEASKELLSNMWSGQTPRIRIGGPNLSNKRINFVSIASQRNDTTIDQIGSLSHELEHAKQVPFRLMHPKGSSEETKTIYSDMSQFAKEIPPSVGDVAFTVKSYEQTVGKSLNTPIKLFPNITHDAHWIANQAEQHGYFQGRSMTEILATPSGQAYLNRALSNDGNKNQSYQYGGIVNYYQDGGEVNEQLLKHIVNNLSTYWMNRGPDKRTDKASATLENIFNSKQEQATELRHILHSTVNSPRYQSKLEASVEKTSEGIKFNYSKFTNPEYIKESVSLLSRMYSGKVPSTNITTSDNGSLYNPTDNIIKLSTKDSYASINPIATLRHELEHSTQGKDELDLINTPLNRIKQRIDLYRNINEIPASLGDLPFTAVENNRLTRPIEIVPSISQSPDWMANQARQHGFFEGKTTTELLATPSRQSYINRLLDSTKEKSTFIQDISNISLDEDTKTLELIKNKDIKGIENELLKSSSIDELVKKHRMSKPQRLQDGGEILAGKGDVGNKDKDIVTFMATGGDVQKSISELVRYWNNQPGTDIGSARVFYDRLHKFASSHPDQIVALASHLHDENIPREQLAKAIGNVDIHVASTKLLTGMYKGKSPDVTLTDRPDSNFYNVFNKKLLTSVKSDRLVSPITAFSHELEHAKQQATDFSNIGRATAEIPSVLGEIALAAKSYEHTTGNKLTSIIDVGPNTKQQANQVAEFFEKQGYFKGRSATEILSTPQGQAYLKQLITKPQPQSPIVPRSGGPSPNYNLTLPDINLIGGPDANIVRNILSRVPFSYNAAPVLTFADGGDVLNPLLTLLPPSAQLAVLAAKKLTESKGIKDLDPSILNKLRTPSLAPSSNSKIPMVTVGGPSPSYNFALPNVNAIGGIDSDIVRRTLGPIGWNFAAPLQMAAEGGFMQPKGTDTIPAMLTRGEYVMPARQTEKYLPVLERMRDGVFMAEGGRVDLPNRVFNGFKSPTMNKVSNTTDNSKSTHVNIHVNMNGTPMEHGVGRRIGKEIQREIRRGNLKLS